jgi:hypothetical protein
MAEPNFIRPKIEKELPYLARDRSDNEEPR